MSVLKKIWKVVEFFLIPFLAAFVFFLLVWQFGHGHRLFVVEYTLSDEGSYYILSDYGVPILNREFKIPEEYNGKPVAEIGDEAFSGCFSLRSIVIPDSVTSIDLRAFYGCESLTDVYYTGSE